MKVKFIYIPILLILITSLHLIGVLFKIYEKNIGIDIPQHFLGGMIFGIAWLLILKNRYGNLNAIPPLVLNMSTIGFALLGSFAWEIFEFLFLKFLPIYALNFKLYSLTLGESLRDIFFGLIGGIVLTTLSNKPN